MMTLDELCQSIPGMACKKSRPQQEQGRHVISIDWTAKDLKGTIPDEIGYLTRLERLKLGRNELYGSLPASLSQLKYLEHLELFRNDFLGPLPLADWSQMTEMKRLLLQSNHFTGTISESLCQMTSLHGIDLFQNPLTGQLPDCLGSSLESLETFQIHDTQLNGTVPIGLCERMTTTATSTTSLECPAIACPMYTYEPTKGRQSSSSSGIDCQPCPTALFLGSTTCPPADETIPPFSSSIPPTESPSMLNTPTVVPTPLPLPATTELPSWHDGTLTTTMHPSNSISTSWNSVRPSSSVPSATMDAASSLAPIEESTFHPTLGSTGPPYIAVLAPRTESTNTTTSPYDDSSSTTTNWTLLAAACLLSALAMLTVVWARRGRQSWWRVDTRQQQQPIHGDSAARPRPPPPPPPLPSSSSSRKQSGGRDSMWTFRSSSFSSGQSSYLSHTTNASSGPRRRTLSGDFSSFRSRSFYPRPEDPLSLKHDQDDNCDEDLSLESDSGWNDTVSSVDDEEDNDNDPSFSTSSSSSSSDGDVVLDANAGSFPNPYSSSLTTGHYGDYRSNDLIPV
jgi:hypothetical protein